MSAKFTNNIWVLAEIKVASDGTNTGVSEGSLAHVVYINYAYIPGVFKF